MMHAHDGVVGGVPTTVKVGLLRDESDGAALRSTNAKDDKRAEHEVRKEERAQYAPKPLIRQIRA